MASGKVTYERTDAHARVIVWSLVIFAVTIIASFIGMKKMYDKYSSEQEAAYAADANPFGYTDQLPPAPRLQASPAHDLEMLAQDEERSLEQYRWVDKDNGIVQVPLEKAIEHVAAHGLPDWTPPPSDEPEAETSNPTGAQGEAEKETAE